MSPSVRFNPAPRIYFDHFHSVGVGQFLTWVSTATQPFFNAAVKQIRFAQVTELDEQLLIGGHSSAPTSSSRL
jgi:hypothetical protein